MSWLSNATGRDKRNEKRMSKQAADPYNPSNLMGAAIGSEGGYATEDRSRLLSILGGGQEALNQYAQSAMSAAMPSFMGQLQGVRESAQRRGISTGDLGTSYEGDLASAFQQNIADAIAQQSMNLYGQQLGTSAGMYDMSRNNYLDLIHGAADRKDMNRNAKKDRQAGLYGAGMNAIANGAGRLYGAKG